MLENKFSITSTFFSIRKHFLKNCMVNINKYISNQLIEKKKYTFIQIIIY